MVLSALLMLEFGSYDGEGGKHINSGMVVISKKFVIQDDFFLGIAPFDSAHLADNVHAP